jgi:hypothetical protein
VRLLASVPGYLLFLCALLRVLVWPVTVNGTWPWAPDYDVHGPLVGITALQGITLVVLGAAWIRWAVPTIAAKLQAQTPAHRARAIIAVVVIVMAVGFGLRYLALTVPPRQKVESANTRQPSANTEQPLPPDQAAKVTGNASVVGGDFQGDIYNGSDWTVDRMIVRVVASRTLADPPLNHYPADEVPAASASDPSPVADKQILWNREFRVSFHDYGGIAPLTTEPLRIFVGGEFSQLLNSSWQIVQIFGTPPASK